MKKLFYILLFVGFAAYGQSYYCYGNKEGVEKVENIFHEYRKATESNYKCEKWSLIIADSLSSNYYIVIDKKDIGKIQVPEGVTIAEKLPKSFVKYKDANLTSDKRYIIGKQIDEKTVMVDRDKDGKIIESKVIIK